MVESSSSVVRIDPGVHRGWADPRWPFTLEGVIYKLVEAGDLATLFFWNADDPMHEVARFGLAWRPRDVFTAAVCHRFHLIWPP